MNTVLVILAVVLVVAAILWVFLWSSVPEPKDKIGYHFDENHPENPKKDLRNDE